MNTYLIPVTEYYISNRPYFHYNYFAFVHANTSKEAYIKAKQISNFYGNNFVVSDDESAYEVYNTELNIPKIFFHESEKNDIMSLSFKKTKGYKYMAYFNVNWNEYTKDLAALALKEDWSNKTYPDNGVLANYIVKTYNKLQSE